MRPRSGWRLFAFALLALAAFAGFVALGSWQVERRAWKLDLIARVDARLRAPPAAAPGPDAWTRIGTDDAYRRLRAEGVYDHAHETLVQAVTEKGPGFWVLTPLDTREGWIVLVNRGFVRPEHRDPATRAAGQLAGDVGIEGLLRTSEPGGAFLRHNDPAAGRWYSRDVAAIAAARGLPADRVAPYFIDADAGSGGNDGRGGAPLGGLTVVRFHNSHLVYAITWYALALMVAAGAALVARSEWRMRNRARQTA